MFSNCLPFFATNLANFSATCFTVISFGGGGAACHLKNRLISRRWQGNANYCSSNSFNQHHSQQCQYSSSISCSHKKTTHKKTFTAFLLTIATDNEHRHWEQDVSIVNLTMYVSRVNRQCTAPSCYHIYFYHLYACNIIRACLDVRAFQNRVLNTRGIKNTNCENYKLLQYVEKLYCILMVLGIFCLYKQIYKQIYKTIYPPPGN